jgi:hypothetical protein
VHHVCRKHITLYMQSVKKEINSIASPTLSF